MRKLTVLLPSIHRDTHPSLCACLRDNGEREVRIVGVDMGAEGVGRHIADVFYQVPPRSDPAYIDAILDICKTEGVDVYYALGEEEAITAAARRGDFAALGAGVITPGTPEMLAIATNKCRWHNFFETHGIPHARYRIVESFSEIATAAAELGYPDRDVFFKPAVSKGGRGALVVTARDLSRDYYDSKAERLQLSLAAFMEMLFPLRESGFRPLLAMEYLPGTYYSVDVLSRDGEAYYTIPKIRIAGNASNTTIGQVDFNRDAAALAQAACRAFGFSYLQNYEMKMNAEGKPMVYDINPRGGASLALCAAAGANLAYFAVKMAVGEDVPRVQVRGGVRMVRYFNEYYE